MEMCKDVADILDLFYEKDGIEPDWAAISTKIYFLQFPVDVMLQLLKTMWLVYEDESAGITAMYAGRISS